MNDRYSKRLKVIRIAYIVIAAVGLTRGLFLRSAYAALLSTSTLALPALLKVFTKLTRLKPGAALETFIYLFALIGWSLGGALEFYRLIPGYDKLAHTLSGAFVALLAFALFLYLERGRERGSVKPAAAVTYVFFASMAVAGLFELCECALSPIVGLDLQRVKTTGVGDTMGDMLVCMIGTLPALFPIWRYFKGRDSAFTDAAARFMKENGFL